MPWLTLLLACGGAKDPEPADADADADADTDTDADADADTDADTDSDSDADSDADADTGSTGDTGSAACSMPEDLVPRIEARDASGPCAVCDGATVVIVAQLTNPCPVDVGVHKYEPEGLLVRDWDLTDPAGANLHAYAYYYGPPVLVVVPAGSLLEQEWAISEAIGPLGPGTWQMGAELATTVPFAPTGTFDVQ